MNIRNILNVPHFNDNEPRKQQALNRAKKGFYFLRGFRGEGDAKKSVGKVHKESGLRY